MLLRNEERKAVLVRSEKKAVQLKKSQTYTGTPQRRMAFVGKGGARELAEFSKRENGALFTSLRRGKHRARIAAGHSKNGQKPEPTLI